MKYRWNPRSERVEPLRDDGSFVSDPFPVPAYPMELRGEASWSDDLLTRSFGEEALRRARAAVRRAYDDPPRETLGDPEE